ncbi:MAG: hypothetical protein CMJ78_11925 [Planctomycetaceae bacterium]|nr:hypothetical protein [Planctomycetaceae bacterium]
MNRPQTPAHPVFSRRSALQAGGIGVLGLGISELTEIQTAVASDVASRAKSVIFVFLTGGISHQDSFDMKPEASETVRGEFNPINSVVPGISICEHLPLLAQRTDKFAQVRSIGTESNGHEFACHMMLTGRLDMPAGFTLKDIPNANEWPSIPSQLTYALEGRNNLPPAIILPEPSVNEANRVRPGQYAGRLGSKYEAWHVDIAAKCPLGNGACPDCFRFDGSEFQHAADSIFATPMLTLPEGGSLRLRGRVGLLGEIERQREDLQRIAQVRKLDRHRQQAISVLADPKTSRAFDVENADPKLIERYGKNKFGLSALMAFRLVDAGVKLVQVNLVKNSSWDTHQRNFPNLRDNLFPPADQALSALIDDLNESGLMDETLLIITGEFGRTPKINKNGGRDHWGPVMTSLFAGAGVRGGHVIGKTDKIAAYPIADKQTPENVAATIFDALGIPRSMHWKDIDGRPHEMYRAEPIYDLYS